MCCQVWSLRRRHARAQTSLAVLWRCLRIGLTTGRLARIPDSHSLLRTVWSEIRTFARPRVLWAVSSAIIIRFLRWIRPKCLSWRYDVTCNLTLRGLSFVLPVCRRRIISLEMVILDTLKWSATPWWVIPAWSIPTARSRSFWRSRGIDVLVKIQIQKFWFYSCRMFRYYTSFEDLVKHLFIRSDVLKLPKCKKKKSYAVIGLWNCTWQCYFLFIVIDIRVHEGWCPD